MSRFEDLLGTQLPCMRMAYELRHQDNGACRESFIRWRAFQQEHTPAFDASYRLDRVSTTDTIWSLRKAFILYRDHELTVSMDYWGYEDSIHRYGWYEREKETLGARLREPASQVALLAIPLGFILDVYEDDEAGSAFHRRLGKEYCAPVFEWRERRSVYNATAPFFGRAFRPVIEAFKLHLRGEHTDILYPCSSHIEASKVNRLLAEHLGILRYNCLAGKAHRLGQRCEVALAAYSESERLQVASYLMTQQRPPIPVRLLLCELALRKVIPQGTYDIQV